MMKLNELTQAQQLVLFGQIFILVGGMAVSLGTLLSMSEPPVEPLSFGNSKHPNLSGGGNSAQSFFF